MAPFPQLTSRQRACVLRALHKAHEQIVDERMRLAALDPHLSKQQRQQLIELEAESECLASAINWLWRQI